MKIAILFRGPVRPNPQSVVARFTQFMQQFNGIRTENNELIIIHTYLATWKTWKQYNASDLLALNLFDNVIMQEEPTDEIRERCTKLKFLPNGASLKPVYNMYYQSKMALNLIENSDDYAFVIHTRTDLELIFGQYISEWFDIKNYCAPHVHPNPWMCDQFGIAPAHMMYDAWNYGSIDNLAKLIEKADIPERVLEMMMTSANIPVKAPKCIAWNLDPTRNN